MSNDKETKPEIKLNRKMRMWNKYRIFCIYGNGKKKWNGKNIEEYWSL